MMMGMGTPRNSRMSERIAASGVGCLAQWSDIAPPPAVSGSQAGDECTDEQRDEEPQCCISRSLACFFSSVARSSFCIPQLCLRACIRITHPLLCGLLRQTGALGDKLANILNVFSGQGIGANGVHENAGNFGPGRGKGLLRSSARQGAVGSGGRRRRVHVFSEQGIDEVAHWPTVTVRLHNP